MLRTVTNTVSNYSLFRWKALISGQNIEGSIFPTLCRPSRGGKGEWLLNTKTVAYIQAFRIWKLYFIS